MAELPNVALTLSSTPQNVSLVREMLAAMAASVELDRSDLDDIRTAVTEACNNVVLHAYTGARGPLEVDIFTQRERIAVVVRDHGVGFPAQMGSRDEDFGGLGLQMMRALTRRLELRATPKRGVEARMEFATPGTRALGFARRDRSPLPPRTSPGRDAVAVTLAPARLADALLPRLLGALASYAHFSTDRISDAQLLADALAARLRQSLGARRLSLAVEVEPRDLQLRIGPLESGTARKLIADSSLRDLGPPIEKLADAHQVTSAGRGEILSLRLLDRR